MVLNGKTKKTSENKTDVLVADVDECGAKFSPCRWWAVCVNTLGSYSCHCRKGYGGKQCDVGKYSVYINSSLPAQCFLCDVPSPVHLPSFRRSSEILDWCSNPTSMQLFAVVTRYDTICDKMQSLFLLPHLLRVFTFVWRKLHIRIIHYLFCPNSSTFLIRENSKWQIHDCSFNMITWFPYQMTSSSHVNYHAFDI